MFVNEARRELKGLSFCLFPSALDEAALQAFLRGAVAPMSEVLAGDFDLRVPVVTAVIDSYTKLSISDVVVELVVSVGAELQASELVSDVFLGGSWKPTC